jgi:hypothetical protein
VSERYRQLANDDLGPMGSVALDPDGNAQPLAPSTLSQGLDVLLATEKLALTVFGIQQETLEISEAIEDQACDLAREGHAAVSLGMSHLHQDLPLF